MTYHASKMDNPRMDKHGKIFSFWNYLDLNISSQNHLDGDELNNLVFEFFINLEIPSAKNRTGKPVILKYSSGLFWSKMVPIYFEVRAL